MRNDDTAADKPAATVKKTVTVNAYADPANYDFADERAFAQALDPNPDNDYYATTEREKSDYVAVVGDLEIDLCSSVYRDIREQLAEGVNIGDAEVVQRVRVTTEHDLYTKTAAKSLAEQFAESVPALDGLWRDDWTPNIWKRDEDNEWVINIRSHPLQERKVLAHHSVRSDDERFEGPDEVMSAQWTVELGYGTDAEIAEWSEYITGPFADFVARQPAVQKVRIADCVTRTESEGDCFTL